MRLPGPTPSTTQPPSAATLDDPYIELAIQESPENPPAAYLWQAPEQIMNAPVRFRVGGNFTFPPMSLSMAEFRKIDNIVLIAGGVGINPIMSMLSAMDLQGAGRLGGLPKRLRVLYCSRRGTEGGKSEQVLFEERMEAIASKRLQKKDDVDFEYHFFETGKQEATSSKLENIHIHHRRFTESDLESAVGSGDRTKTLAYICGVPDMTDKFVDFLKRLSGMDEKRVLCEKWW